MKPPTNAIGCAINKFIIIDTFYRYLSIDCFPPVIFKRTHPNRFISSSIFLFALHAENRETIDTLYRPVSVFADRGQVTLHRYDVIGLWFLFVSFMGSRDRTRRPRSEAICGEQRLLFEARGCLSKNILIGVIYLGGLSISVEILSNYFMRLNMFNELYRERSLHKCLKRNLANPPHKLYQSVC